MTRLERLNAGQYGVAEWFYDFTESDLPVIKDFLSKDSLSGESLDEKKNILSILTTSLRILKERQLFTPDTIIAHFTERETKKKCSKKLCAAEEDFQTHLSFMPAQEPHECFYLAKLYIEGTSVIYDGDGRPAEYRGVFYLLFSFYDMLIMTDCDAWLPYDLNGVEQSAVYHVNAPRLTQALEEIEASTGVEPVWDNSPYAIVDKYHLRNFPDDA